MEQICCISLNSMCSFKHLKNISMFVAFFVMTLVPFAIHADSPDLQTPDPVIYLSDNLDEKERMIL